ncbi:MAG: hypothetical protein IJJ11_02790 [Methanosphaera sp.]|nr:hypothetical protein [Methanosphaera sp.]
MMPTQSPDAIVLDGNIIIILGFVALAYLLYKYRNELFAVDNESYENTVDNENIQKVNDENTEYANNTVKQNSQQNPVNIENKESEKEEEYYKDTEKEVLLNYR